MYISAFVSTTLLLLPMSMFTNESETKSKTQTLSCMFLCEC